MHCMTCISQQKCLGILEMYRCGGKYRNDTGMAFCCCRNPVWLTGLSLYMLRPETEKTRSFAAFDHTMIAHRGLFDNHSEAPENSLAAFRKAVDQGFGIELDVQLTKDGKLVVFHDFDLKRMCGIHKKLTELTYAELEQYSLKDSTEKIPLFLLCWI